jgi:hypothetical protein
MARYELQLSYVLEELIHKLEKAGIISINSKEDLQELKKKVLENLEQLVGKGNLPSGSILKDPRMTMKLTLCIVAAHALKKGPAQALTQQAFEFNNQVQFKKRLEELITHMKNNPGLGNAQGFKLLMRLLVKDAKEKQDQELKETAELKNDPNAKEKETAELKNDPNAPDNTLMGIYLGGVLIDLLEGVFGKTKAEQVLTVEEEASMGAQLKPILTFGSDMLEEMNAMERRPMPTLTPNSK